MTPAQTKTHWRLWAAVVRTTGWHMENRELQAPESKLNLFSHQVLELAQRLAAEGGRGPDCNDLRHALYSLACGKLSSSDVNSRFDFTRVNGWLRLCIDDSDLEAARSIQDEEGDQRRRLVVGIRRTAPFAYIDAICRDVYDAEYDPPHWELLPLAALKKLRITLANRKITWSQPACAVQETQPGGQPF